MSKETDLQSLDEVWEGAEDEPENETLLDTFGGHKDARRRLDDLLEERRLRNQMTDDF